MTHGQKKSIANLLCNIIKYSFILLLNLVIFLPATLTRTRDLYPRHLDILDFRMVLTGM